MQQHHWGLCISNVENGEIRKCPKKTGLAMNGVGKGRHGPKLCPVRAPGPRMPPDAPWGPKNGQQIRKIRKIRVNAAGSARSVQFTLVPRSLEGVWYDVYEAADALYFVMECMEGAWDWRGSGSAAYVPAARVLRT